LTTVIRPIQEARVSRKYQIKAGDTLTAVAQKYYGDATLFGLIAAANKLADPNKITPGQVLSIPDLPTHWDVVQVNGTNEIRTTGPLVVTVACSVPAGMRLVIENVSARLVLQPGTMSPLILGQLDPLGRPTNQLAFFPWYRAFTAATSPTAPRGGSPSTRPPVCTWRGRSIT
jgi:LysM repeat protein